jgi:protein-tyrosine-phosphatase
MKKKKSNILLTIFTKWMVDSAGTGSHEAGNQIYNTAQVVLKKHGITYKHTARQVHIFNINIGAVSKLKNLFLDKKKGF